MFTDILIPVRAVRDICGGSLVLVEQGTRGEITGMSGDAYTATFWPYGPDNVQVTIGKLSGNDLIAA